MRRVALLAGLMLALVGGPAYAVTVTTQNVLYTMSPAHARHDIRQAAEHSSVLFTQEMGTRRAARFAPAGWGAAHFTGARRGDCATYWDASVWRRLRAWTVRVSAEPFKAGHRWALVTVLSRRSDGLRLATMCVHLFTHGLDPGRRAAYSRAVDHVRSVADGLRNRWGRVVVGGDWNREWRLRGRMGAGWHTVAPPRGTGPGGGRIDYFWWTGLGFGAQHVVGHTWSDHNGDRLRLRVTRGSRLSHLG